MVFYQQSSSLCYIPEQKNSLFQFSPCNSISFYTKMFYKKRSFTEQRHFLLPHQSTTDDKLLPFLAAQLQLGGTESTGNFQLEFLLDLKSF